MTRPPAVTASAVLLIVVGSELLLTVIAATGVAVRASVTTGETPDRIAIIVVTGFLGVGAGLLTTAIRTLRGTLRSPTRAGDIVGNLGAFAAIPCFLTLFCCGYAAFTERNRLANAMTMDTARLTGGLLLLWANTAALLTAGALLRNSADRYLRWQDARNRPPTDAEYEPE